MSHGAGVTAIISATLQRVDNSTPWGFRLHGGVDVHNGLVIERVIPGSLADRCGLRSGDVVRTISGESTSGMRHQDAHGAVIRAGNFLKLDLQRQTFDRYDDVRVTPNSSTLSHSQSHCQNEPSSCSYTDCDTRSRLRIEARKDTERHREIDAVIDELKNHRENIPRSVPHDHSPEKKNQPIRPSVWSSRRGANQSKSFLLLQKMLECGDEDPKIPRPLPEWPSSPPADYLDAPIESKFPQHRYSVLPDRISEERESQIADAEQSSNHHSSARPSPLPENNPQSSEAPSSSTLGGPAAPGVGSGAASPPYGNLGAPVVPVPRRSPGPRPRPLPGAGGRGGHQPRAFGRGTAVRSAAVNSASRIPICNRCSRNIRGPFIIALDKAWCPDHFLCDKCGTDMVELGFVETPDGKVYCEEDYGRYMAPRCNRCRQAIIGTIVKALSAEWHAECFTCGQCNKSLAGELFHVEDGKPYCEKDYNEMFQTKCKGCDFPIEPGDRWVEAAGDNYHVTCFACTTCQCSLANRGFVMKNGRPYCSTHARGM